jgi:alpha-L-fucosidase
MEFMRVEPWPASDSKLQPSGLQLETYTGDWDVLPDFSTLQPSGESIVDTISADPRNEFEGRVFSGYVHVDRDAMYMFALESDDGSMLLIDDTPIIDNDGLHGSREMRGTAPLAAGWHAIRVEWFNKTGGAELELRMGELGETLMAENLTFTH